MRLHHLVHQAEAGRSLTFAADSELHHQTMTVTVLCEALD